MSTILETKNLKKYYIQGENKVKALDGVDLKVEEGEFVSIIGTSGSGKTTLLNLLGGIDTVSSGSVMIDSCELDKMNREQLTLFRRRRIGFIFQDYNLIRNLNVFDNIALPVELDGKTVDEEYLREIIRALLMEDKLYSMPNNLSGGQQQRVAIARAMTTKPAIILADEPTGNLDSKTSREVIALLKMSNQKFRQTIIMITHNADIARTADRIITLEDGRITREEKL